MIIYQASKTEFLHHSLREDIDEVVSRHFVSATGRHVGLSEVNAWRHSLLEMAKVLQDEEIPADAGIAIEYQLPQTSKRIDFLITGLDEQDRPKVVIVELKQWSSSRLSEKDGIVWAHRGGHSGEREGLHPSYQAWTYAAYLEDFNEAVRDQSMAVQPCAYLHNHPRNGQIDHPHYQPHLERAPLFLARERSKLQAFLRKHVRQGDRKHALYAIENGRIRPSKTLADSVIGLLQGKAEFILIDDQKLAHETILAADRKADQLKQVVIVQGGPGTGKSVIAINLLATLVAKGRNARYVSKNAAPRAVYEAKLTGTFSRTRIGNLFSGSGAFVEARPDEFDVLIVDEAHRLNEKSGLYGNLGENQIKELIQSARCVVFFIDDDQRVTLRDIGHTEELRRHANIAKAEVTEVTLSSQFRCNGSDGYLAWLDDTLEIRRTANSTLDVNEYDFRVFDDPNDLHSLIKSKNQANNRSRVVAGYCWPWPSKRDPLAWDIEMSEYSYQKRWNLDKDGSLWIIAPDSVDEVGCVHTSQGLELDYVGVIIGPDLTYRDGAFVVDAKQRASSDQSVKGLKSLARNDPQRAEALADRIVKNTYKTLLSRGMKGCFVFCSDPKLRDYFRSRLKKESIAAPRHPIGMDEGETVSREIVGGNKLAEISSRGSLILMQRRPEGRHALPVIDLRIAAGGFSDSQEMQAGALAWVEPPNWISATSDLFVARVVGESMNRHIPNGSWCLFRLNPRGTRQGKIVVVQHHSIDDPETGGRFTIKRYSSEKVFHEDGEWRHEAITLSPVSDRPEFKPISLVADDGDQVAVVAEFLMVLDGVA